MKYVGSSKKLRDASVLIHKKHVSKFEASQENAIRSLSMLYAHSLLSKRKYAQSRSALSTFSTGNITEHGYLQRKRLLFSGGIPIPKILPYNDPIHISNNIDIGELLPVANLCRHLPSEDRVDVSLAKFDLDTNCYRKPEERLRWFGGDVGHFRVAVGGDGGHLASGMNQCHGWSVSLILFLVLQAQMITIYYLGLIARKLMRLLPNFVSSILAKECAEIEQRTYTIGDVTVNLHLT
jgi:hypothetical protein